MSFKHSFFYVLLWLLPKNCFSRFLGNLVTLKLPKKCAYFINKSFVRIFGLNMHEAEKNLEDYSCLQDLFTRRLAAHLRPIKSSPDIIVSPCDGFISESGVINNGHLIQIKGKLYSLADLLGSKKYLEQFEGGYFATIYLSPRDYHRFHIPISGHIRETTYIPGTLWPVNEWAVSRIKNLFIQNERIITLLRPQQSTKILAHVAVGACVVGKIKMAYCSLESNSKTEATHESHNLYVERGQDLGVFMFGSTIILLFEAGLVSEHFFNAPRAIKMGEPLARLA
jgi:phosphatidylserine decarboxylase